jgi:hypothetical protein
MERQAYAAKCAVPVATPTVTVSKKGHSHYTTRPMLPC